MSLTRSLHRWWRRVFEAAGDDFIFDYEVAVLQAFMAALAESDRPKLKQQLLRYDRIDHSANRRLSLFVDDDSDYWRSDWPKEILFPVEARTLHVADIRLRDPGDKKQNLGARLLLVRGYLSGCEFDLRQITNRSLHRFAMAEAMADINSIKTSWQAAAVRLYAPFSDQASSRVFDTETK